MTTEAEATAPEEPNRLRDRLTAIGQVLRRNLPRGLFGRSLLIVVLPMILLQTVVAAVFMERHWQMVTTRLSFAVASDIAAIIDLLDAKPDPAFEAELIGIAREKMGLAIAIQPGSELPPPRPVPPFSILDQTLSDQIRFMIKRDFWLNTTDNSRMIEIRILLDDNRILSVVTRRDRTYASNTHIFIIWMVGASLVDRKSVV
jgi:two-component system osmolarity sensor histidine kinase EnvZ